MIHVLLFAAALSTSGTGDLCALPDKSEVAPLTGSAEASFKAGRGAEAAESWLRALQLYPVCVTAFPIRKGLVNRALNALEKASAATRPSCTDPVLQTARLVRQMHAEVMALPDGTPGLGKARADFSSRLARLSPAARDAATFLDGREPPSSMAAVLDQHRGAVAAFGVCPEIRAALVRHVLSALPSELPSPPSCDAVSETARQQLRDAMAALERAEPDGARSTTEYAVLSQRLATLNGIGPALATARAKATIGGDLDRMAAAWATIARELPTCAVYLADMHDAALAAVGAWQRNGQHMASAGERASSSKELLEAVITKIEADHGAKSVAIPEHASLLRARAALVRPQESTDRQSAGEPQLATEPVIGAGPGRWIFRHRPEPNLIEVGAFGGVMAPASGLLDEAGGTHQLYSVAKLQAASDGAYKPYRKVAPEIGLRLAWYPISVLGVEIEGGVMPTRVIEDNAPADRALLYNFRGHLIAQVPLWRVAPFVIVGGGGLGTTGALGADVDPSLNLGVGAKVFLSDRFMLRLDIRDSIAVRNGRNEDGTHYPEVLVGLSVVLNRSHAVRISPKVRPATADRSQTVQGR